MNRLAQRIAGALATVPAVLAGLSVRDLAGALVAMVIVMGVVCWVVTDAARTRRLATLIHAWRGGTPQSQLSRPRPEAAHKRQTGRAADVGNSPEPPDDDGASTTGGYSGLSPGFTREFSPTESVAAGGTLVSPVCC
jgi:hypothetical protein